MPDDELAVLLGKRFIERRDVKAIQFSGGYAPVRACTRNRESGVYACGTDDCQHFVGWKMSDLRQHVEGTQSFGHYMVSPEGQTKLFAFDLDLKKEGYYIEFEEDKVLGGGTPCNPRELWQTQPDHPACEYFRMQLRCLAEGLAMRVHHMFDGEFPVAIAYSGGKGLHVYGFTGSVSAKEARQTALEVLRNKGGFVPIKGENFWQHDTHFNNIEIEVFPKQESLEGKDFGNLMRLPLGKNLKTGQRSYFLDCRCQYTEFREMNPMDALGGELPWD